MAIWPTWVKRVGDRALEELLGGGSRAARRRRVRVEAARARRRSARTRRGQAQRRRVLPDAAAPRPARSAQSKRSPTWARISPARARVRAPARKLGEARRSVADRLAAAVGEGRQAVAEELALRRVVGSRWSPRGGRFAVDYPPPGGGRLALLPSAPHGQSLQARRAAAAPRPPPPPIADVERLALATFTEKAYLDYSMYVILDRALPPLADGLKPVQRRIVYAMSELGLSADRQVQEVGAHGGRRARQVPPARRLACYEAMVLMAQPFSFRYPLVDGQGNWGSQDDPKLVRRHALHRGAADAVRRRRSSPSSAQGTVDWGPNFDGTLDEPEAAAVAAAARAAQRRLRHRRRHGHRHPAAQRARGGGGRRSALLDDPKLPDDELYAAHPRPRLPDRRPRSSRPPEELPAALRDRLGLDPHARRLGAEDGDVVDHRPALPGLGQQGAARRSPRRCRRRSCPWSRTCATSPTTRTRRAW